MTSSDRDNRQSLNALPAGTVLRDYVIESELGSGGFSIVYLARHHLDPDWLYAIKEFLPGELAVRARDGTTVHPVNTEAQEAFDDGLRRFRDEAGQLRKFRNEPAIVSCVNYFEGNGTAYLVMDHDDGLPLSELLRRREAEGQPFTEQDLLAVVEPLLEGLTAVHRAGVLHRDIKPGNIFVRRQDDITGRPAHPVLIDFGAAKQNYLARHSRSRAPYTPGYAAYEQVSSMGEIGPWTDVYALGALMWRMVAGGCADDARLHAPDVSSNSQPETLVWTPAPREVEKRAYAMNRAMADPMPSAAALGAGRFAHRLLEAIDGCLALYPEGRVRTCEELRASLRTPAASGGRTPKSRRARSRAARGILANGAQGTDRGEADAPAGSARSGWRPGRRFVAALAGAAAVAAIVVAGAAWFGPRSGGTPGMPEQTAPAIGGTPAEPPSVFGGSAMLVVETTPPGAQVYVDGAPVGTTPLQREDMAPGTRDIEARLADHETLRLAGQALADGRVLRVERALVRGTGALTVVAAPPAAWVELDGERVAQRTPVTLDGLPAGEVRVRLGAPEHAAETVVAWVPMNGVGRLDHRLEPIPHGTLTLELDPADAEVALPGVGQPYRRDMRLPEGEHEVVVRRDGYADSSRLVRVEGDTVASFVLRSVEHCQSWNTAAFFANVTPQEVEDCLQWGADVNETDDNGNTPLHWAGYNENPEIAIALLDAGADVNATNNVGSTPLLMASSNENPDVAIALLDAGADVNATNNVGSTPLLMASSNENPDVAIALLDAGADVDATNNDGSTPLHWAAAFNENPEVANALLDAGMDVNEKDDDGWTLLHWAAAFNENPEVANALLDAGADVNATDDVGLTPLHRAAALNENADVAIALLDAGGNVNATSDNGFTPLYLAVELNENPEVAETIREAGGR